MTNEDLKKLMNKKKIDARTLANLTGMHESTVSRYLSGILEIPKKSENLIKMSLALRK